MTNFRNKLNKKENNKDGDDDSIDDERINQILDSIHKDIESLSATTVKEVPLTTKKHKRKYFPTLKQESEDKVITEAEKSYLASKSRYMDMTLFNSDKDIIPDVYRRPGFTNIYKRLLMQIEANDSFICFQKLMNRRHPGAKQHTRPYSAQQEKGHWNNNSNNNISSNSSILYKSCDALVSKKDIRKKYKNSLWFSHDIKKLQKDSAHGKRQRYKANTKSLSKVSQNSLSAFSFGSFVSNEAKNGRFYKYKSPSASSLKKLLKDRKMSNQGKS